MKNTHSIYCAKVFVTTGGDLHNFKFLRTQTTENRRGHFFHVIAFHKLCRLVFLRVYHRVMHYMCPSRNSVIHFVTLKYM